MLTRRQEIIGVFVVRAAPADRDELRRKLERMTLGELEEAYKVVQLQATEEKLLQIQTERAADTALHELHIRRIREPQRKAEAEQQEKLDRETFKQAAKTLRSFGENQANWNVISSTLGPGFSIYQVQQMISANGGILSPPSQQEQDEWTRQDIEEHNLRLLNSDLPTLRRLAREAGARGPAPVAPDEIQRVRAAERNDGVSYPPLPDEFRDGDGSREVVLNSQFIKNCSKETLKRLRDRYGWDQVNEALRTRIGGSWQY
jgi:hypothetical protein